MQKKKRFPMDRHTMPDEVVEEEEEKEEEFEDDKDE
jgi:hypothetical protein